MTWLEEFTNLYQKKDINVLLKTTENVFDKVSDLWSRKLTFSQQNNYEVIITVSCKSENGNGFSSSFSVEKDLYHISDMNDSIEKIHENLNRYSSDDYLFEISLLVFDYNNKRVLDEDIIIIYNGEKELNNTIKLRRMFSDIPKGWWGLFRSYSSS